MASIDTSAADPRRWLFVTLTYPGEFSRDPQAWKRDLDVWWKRWVRAWGGDWVAVWKMEPQRRGAPHYHLILIPPKGKLLSPADLYAWVSSSWYEVVGSGDQRHAKAGTNVQMVRTYGGAIHYAAKYCGKVCEGFLDEETGEALSVGRYWGCFNRAGFPILRTVYRLSEPQAWRLRRVLRRVWSGCGKAGRLRSYTVYLQAGSMERLMAWVGAWRLSESSERWFCNPGVLPATRSEEEVTARDEGMSEWQRAVAYLRAEGLIPDGYEEDLKEGKNAESRSGICQALH